MNRCLAAFLALLFASVTISSACFAHSIDQASRTLTVTTLN